MIAFTILLIALIAGYFVCGTPAEKVFQKREDWPVPAIRQSDGLDYTALPKRKTQLVRLLNIAGIGTVFAAISGALFASAAFAWIVFGCIFAAAVHNYMVGMFSLRNDGFVPFIGIKQKNSIK